MDCVRDSAASETVYISVVELPFWQRDNFHPPGSPPDLGHTPFQINHLIHSSLTFGLNPANDGSIDHGN